MHKVVPSEVINYIDSKYPDVLNELKGKFKAFHIGPDHIASVTTVLMMVDAIPKHLIIFEGDEALKFIEAVETIRFAVSLWNAGDKTHHVGTIRGRGNLNAMTILRKQLESLHDEGIEPTINKLIFIKDKKFRELLRRDLSSVKQAFDNNEWKATTVLGGSVVEAFLLYALLKYKKKNGPKFKSIISTHKLSKKLLKNDLKEWHLYELTEVAYAASLIEEGTASQCKIARDFRNFIHPGMEVRLDQECDKATVHSVLAAVFHVIRDLTP